MGWADFTPFLENKERPPLSPFCTAGTHFIRYVFGIVEFPGKKGRTRSGSGPSNHFLRWWSVVPVLSSLPENLPQTPVWLVLPPHTVVHSDVSPTAR